MILDIIMVSLCHFFQDESRLKTVCMSATPVDWVEDGKRLADEINRMLG